MKVIKCLNCKKKITGKVSFDELAKAEGWIKRGKFYVCPDCEMPLKKKKTNRIDRYSKKVEDDEYFIPKHYD